MFDVSFMKINWPFKPKIDNIRCMTWVKTGASITCWNTSPIGPETRTCWNTSLSGPQTPQLLNMLKYIPPGPQTQQFPHMLKHPRLAWYAWYVEIHPLQARKPRLRDLRARRECISTYAGNVGFVGPGGCFNLCGNRGVFGPGGMYLNNAGPAGMFQHVKHCKTQGICYNSVL